VWGFESPLAHDSELLGITEGFVSRVGRCNVRPGVVFGFVAHGVSHEVTVSLPQ